MFDYLQHYLIHRGAAAANKRSGGGGVDLGFAPDEGAGQNWRSRRVAGFQASLLPIFFFVKTPEQIRDAV
jgi:hypothetical protein